jgi:hypothetical protein
MITLRENEQSFQGIYTQTLPIMYDLIQLFGRVLYLILYYFEHKTPSNFTHNQFLNEGFREKN